MGKVPKTSQNILSQAQFKQVLNRKKNFLFPYTLFPLLTCPNNFYSPDINNFHFANHYCNAHSAKKKNIYMEKKGICFLLLVNTNNNNTLK